MYRRLPLAVLLFVFSLVAGASEVIRVQVKTSGRNETRELRVPSAAAATKYIVEFESAAGAAAPRDLFRQLRRDLGELQPRIAANGTAAEPATVRHEYRHVYAGAAVTVSPATAARLRRLPYVRAVHEDSRVKVLAGGITAADAGSRIDAAGVNSRGRGISVAVIDTGIDYMHPALGGGFGAGRKVIGGWDFVNNDADPMDDEGHGTHVAGIVAANSADLVGVAPEATLLAYKALDRNGGGDESDVIAAIERAIDPNGDGNFADRAQILNLSIGGRGDADSPVSKAVDRAVAAGAVVIVAAGNDSRRMSIGAPASARLAITVGASDVSGRVAYFSSKGPTPQLEFKPDVVAPGMLIPSAKRGGGTIELSGTSMAAPHVAGAAALLLALHPEWTPAQVKGALVGTATPLEDEPPLDSGAGRINVGAANQATLLLEGSTINFSAQTAKTGTWQQNRTLRVTNRARTEQVVTITPTSASRGIKVSAAPQVTIAPGATAEITVTASADNGKLGYPDTLSGHGTVKLTGSSSSVTVPWGFVRATRTTVHFEPGPNEGYDVEMTPSEEARIVPVVVSRLSPSTVDIIAAGGKYDVLLFAFTNSPDGEQRGPVEARILIRSRVDVSGEQVVDFRNTRQHKIVLNAVDPEGRPLSGLPVVYGQRERFTWWFLERVFKTDLVGIEAFYSYGTRDLRTIYVSDAPGEYTFTAAEAYADAAGRRVVVAQHQRLPLAASATLTSNPADYFRMTAAPRAGLADKRGGLCVNDSFASMTAASTLCFVESADLADGKPVEIFTTASPRNWRGYVAPSVVLAGVSTRPLRVFNGAFAATFGTTLAPTDAVTPNHGSVTVGGGPVFPLCMFGGRCGTGEWTGIYGPSGEDHQYARYGGVYRVFDEANKQVATGTIDDSDRAEPALSPGWRAELVISTLRAGNRSMLGVLEIRRGSSTDDATPPKLTAMAVRNAAGALTDRLANGEQGKLTFSAGDFRYGMAFGDEGGYRQVNGALAQEPGVSFRVHGTTPWSTLAVAKTGSDEAAPDGNGWGNHLPVGDIYEVHLAAATAVPNTLVDLRFTLVDASGNQYTWTQEGALTVGELPSLPTAPRRRSVRK